MAVRNHCPGRKVRIPLEFKVFGELQVTHDGAAIAVARRKCQALLALLISQHPHGVSADGVADALWPYADPEKAANSVRVHVTFLRRSLVAAPGVIPRTTGRYSLAVDRSEIDVLRFEDLGREARNVAAAGDPRQACALYERAIAEKRGVPYAEFRDIDALRDEFTRLDELCLDVLDGYATALLDDDRADEACRILEPAVDANLIRETLAARLMLALYRTGRQQDALAIFGRVRAALTEGLGLLPSNQLQGLAEAIVLQRDELDLGRAGARTSRATLPPRQRAQFVGRAAELRALATTWDRAIGGEPQLAYLSGLAGVGKSSVMQRFVDEVTSTGANVVIGHCDPDPADNYQPFPDLVRALLTHAPPTDTSPRLLGELRRLTPDLADRLPIASEPPEPGAGRQRLFAAVASLLAMPSQPRLLVIEDLHWARPDALLLLRHVLRAATGQLMVLGTFRREELQPESSVNKALAGGRLGHPDTQITIKPMNRHEVVALIDAVAPTDRRTVWLEHLDELIDVSAGNPLRLREVLRQLELEPNASISEIAPDDVRALVTRRVQALDETTRTVLQTAAVLGRAFSLSQVAAAAGVSEDATLDALERAGEAGLVVEDEQVDDFTFSHPLFRNSIYHGLTQSRRARRHIACADVIAAEMERDPAERKWAEVARHLVAARPVSDAARAAEFARRAGHDAAMRYAHEEAVAWYRHAVEGATAARMPDRDVADLRLALGTELELSGSLDAAHDEFFEVAEVARANPDSDLLERVVVALTPRSAVLDTHLAPILGALAEEALVRGGPGDPERIRVLRSAAFARYYGDPTSVSQFASEATRLAEQTDDPQLQNWSMVLQYLAEVRSPEHRLALAGEIKRHTDQHHLLIDNGMASRRLLIELLGAGLMADFDRELEIMSATARTTAIPYDLYWSSAFRSTRAMMRDCSALTEELVNASAVLGRQLQVFESTGMHLLQTFALRYQQGRTRELTRELSAPSDPEPQIVAGTALLALSFAESNRMDLARGLLDRVVDADGVALPNDNFWFGGVGLFGGVAAACGSPAQQQVIREALEQHADSFCVFGAGGAVFGTGHHWIARLAAADGDSAAARDHLSAAAQICDHAGAGFWADRARSEMSRLGEPSATNGATDPATGSWQED
jgi:Predicted ATPase